MTIAVEFLIDSFERLSEREKKQFAFEVLRRISDLNYAALSDEELLLSAEAVFLELDQQEVADGLAQTW
ncbi:MAG: hypothetical protein HND44_07505 [Chloroflexi bacterium]|nr:hypothetical protein [Ardenticatenaceae bacterium]MBL1128334.1 hypothetical protein [Chloroflexota bacterium]NOG34409.1 hypothetical protein [Chloroflexota bacterium]GIK55962.1 MAG: hypothetical protein BroJett015_16250 [Chloroflexota bacterium]